MSDRPDQIQPTFPNLGYAVCLVIGLLMVQVGGGGLIGSFGLAKGGEAGDGLNPWTLGLVNLVATGMVLAVAFRATREAPGKFFSIRPFNPRLLPAVVITSLGLVVVLSATTNLIMEAMSLLPGYKDFGDLFKWRAFPVGTVFSTMLVAPLAEEYLFRGMILRGLLAHHRPGAAIGLTALIFGVVHANPPQFVLGTILGGVVGWWYVQTRSIAPGLIGHAIFNAVGCGSMLLPGLAQFGFSYPGEPIIHEPWWLTLGGLALTGAGLWWFRHLTGPLPAPAMPPMISEPPLIAEPPPLVAEAAPDQPPASPAS